METQLWSQFEKALKKRVGLTSYNRWLSQLAPKEVLSKKLVLACPNKFVLDWINKNYRKDIVIAFKEVSGRDVSLSFFISNSKEKSTDRPSAPPQQLALPGVERFILGLPLANREHTFQNFVVGPGNHLAYASALAVAERKPRMYNPLFFYSSEGLGKTHLSSAMGQKIFYNNPNIKVFYTTAEWFTHEMIQALRKNYILEFKEKYRKQCDVLFVEDIQFLQGKEKTQEEIFYTLDALIRMDKQVILTANSNPREINNLKANLKSRMGSGLVVDIKPPDYETKKSIIARKCADENIKMPEDVVDYIAKSIKSNVRDLKSAVIQIFANSSLLGQKIDLDLAKETLKSFVQKKAVSIVEIQKFISHHFKVSPDQLHSKSRCRAVNYPRQVAYYFCRKYTDNTLTAIGKCFNRNHSSVLRALNRFDIAIRTNRGIRDALDYLTKKFEKAYF